MRTYLQGRKRHPVRLLLAVEYGKFAIIEGRRRLADKTPAAGRRRRLRQKCRPLTALSAIRDENIRSHA
jgi:hypothetical protein